MSSTIGFDNIVQDVKAIFLQKCGLTEQSLQIKYEEPYLRINVSSESFPFDRNGFYIEKIDKINTLKAFSTMRSRDTYYFLKSLEEVCISPFKLDLIDGLKYEPDAIRALVPIEKNIEPQDFLAVEYLISDYLTGIIDISKTLKENK
ncbi:hypothetical protein [Pontibacter sp. H249]|uniref:hypothetical protein n=1 Tax=Pontibacter sp. H249 TaxID=3133420 RepID=UPI0030C28D64